MATPISQEDINFLRLAGLLIRIAPRAVRQRFDFEFDPLTLQTFLSKNRREIEELRWKRVITKAQYDLLYPKASSGLSSETFDVPLIFCLMKDFTNLDIHDVLPNGQINDTGADISRIKFYRNHIVHSNSGKLTKDKFTEIWNCVVEAILRLVPDLKPEIDALMGSPLTNVGELKDVIRLELQLEKNSRRLEKLEIENNNIAEIRHATLKEWKDTDMTYVSTSAMTFIQETLQHNKAVIITGSPGCGKSTVAHHVAFKLEEEGFELIPLDDPSEICKSFTKVRKQVFVIDDVCGKFALNKHEADKWEKTNFALDKLVVSCDQNDNFTKLRCPPKFIFTCRENIFTHKAFPKLTCFSLVQCSLSNKYKISPDEMRKIALSYVSDQTVTDIPNMSLYDFFPLLCYLYSKKNNLDPRFFTHPVEIIEKEISEMKKKSEIDFLCLSLLVLKNNKCSKAELISGELDKELKNICRESGIESVVSTVFMYQSFERFKGMYISESDQNYQSIHDKMFDIISAAVAPLIIESLIEYVDIAFLASRIQLSSLGESSLPFVIYIPHRLETMYLQRQYKEVKKGRNWEVFGSIQTENDAYRNLLISFLKDQDMSKPNVYLPEVDGATPLFVSSSLGYIDFVQYFIVKRPDDKNTKDKKGRSPFYIACENGHIATVKYLLKCSVDITIKNIDGLSALHTACCRGHTEIIEILIDIGMNINDTTEESSTPLHLACKHGHYGAVKLLFDMSQQILERHLDITIKDLDGETVLHQACITGQKEIIKLLIGIGMNINDASNDGATPFMHACSYGHYDIVEFLLQQHQQASNCIVDIPKKDTCQYSALHYACMSGNVKLVKLLIDVGMDINNTTNAGYTPLHIACHQGYHEIVKFLLDLNDQSVTIRVDLMVKLLDGSTALQIAYNNGYTEIVKLLIDAGCTCE